MEKIPGTAKLFPLDKNYLLKEAQFVQREALLTSLVEKVIQVYQQHFNPLGLVDDTIISIRNVHEFEISSLYGFYHDLSGIYRYQNDDNQLEILFDGDNHFEKFKREWKEAFNSWTDQFCLHRNFLKAVLEGAVIVSDQKIHFKVENRFKVFLAQQFELKVYKYKGIQEFSVA